MGSNNPIYPRFVRAEYSTLRLMNCLRRCPLQRMAGEEVVRVFP